MFQKTIHNSLRKVLIKIAQQHKINQEKLLQNYLNEYDCNTQLTLFKYQDHNLIKDCFNNLYLSDENNNLDLIGYINKDSDIIFDKLVKKTIIKPQRKSKKIEEKS